MAILTVILVAMFFAAWKAPRWVKEIGACALAFGIFSSMLGVIQMLDAMLDAVQQVGEISTAVLCGGFKVTLIPTIYGMIIYMISLIIRISEKPRV